MRLKCALLILLASSLLFTSPVASGEISPSPDLAEPGSVEAIREATTGSEYLPASVAYVPESASVPSPADVLGRIVGAPEELTSVSRIYDYYRKLAAASDRVDLEIIGTTEEGRDLLLIKVSDAANLQNIDRYKGITSRLADPARTSREEMESLASEGIHF
jgi:hypothetical protein